MGTIQFYTDVDGNDVGLYDHEGYVELELTVPWPEADPAAAYGELDDVTGTWWTSTWSSGRPATTGRYRAGCECGWRGPIVVLDVDDVDGEPSEDDRDRIMDAPGSWRQHVQSQIGLDQVRSAGERERAAANALAEAVRSARAAHQSWTAIGQALRVTRQSAWERFRHLDPRPADE